MDRLRLLIVEDDLDLSEMVSSYFRVQNYDVMTAAWAEEALELTASNPFDLIMLDIRLPDIHGFELCCRLRNHRSNTRSRNRPRFCHLCRGTLSRRTVLARSVRKSDDG